MKRKLVQNGRGIIVNLPPAYLDLIGIKAGDEVGITVKDDNIQIYKIKSYCTQNDGLCENCSLVNYQKDCHNNNI
jgi:hypothetical protein